MCDFHALLLAGIASGERRWTLKIADDWNGILQNNAINLDLRRVFFQSDQSEGFISTRLER